jgi:hypothetical protein
MRDTEGTDSRSGRDSGVDPRHGLSFLEWGGRNIVPVTAEGAGKNFLQPAFAAQTLYGAARMMRNPRGAAGVKLAVMVWLAVTFVKVYEATAPTGVPSTITFTT